MQISDKKRLRSEIKAIRFAMSKKEKADRDRRIYENVIGSQEYKDCSELLIYISGQIEVDTSQIIKDAVDQGKAVYVPRCVAGTNVMEFYRIRSRVDLIEGYFGILEPKEECETGTYCETSLCIVPGLAYDKNGFRLGFGKGFYDKYLSAFPGKTIGICYDSCIIDNVYKEAHDIAVMKLISESGIRIVEQTREE